MSVKGGRIEVTVALDADPNSATMVVLAPHRKAEPFSDDLYG
ncbi:hypothetical protein [Phocaeicola sp.]|nr:hypothetical protein [Phocaeicola sp.]